MVKIQAQAGNSLADIYDVQGSIAGIDQLETRELPIVHEMGATVFSERYVTTFRRLATGDQLQNTDLDVLVDNLPVTPTRLFAVTLFSDAPARLLNLSLVLRDPLNLQEIPIWTWAVGNFQPARFLDVPGLIATQVLQPQNTFMPVMVGGSGQGAGMMHGIAIRGRTTGFGAGTVFVRALIYIGFAFLGGISSRGVPFPSW